jgi:ATP-dependent helicase HrpB
MSLFKDSRLPIDALLPQICSGLHQNTRLVLTAEPGAGKTTRVPLAMLEEPWLGGKTIIMLEPRRLAARNAARFMAQQLGESVGETVGYRIRLEQKSSASTRILVVTEGILTRMLQSDPELGDVGLIIFDEFHERHLHSDLALALSIQCQEVLRDDLRILLMSATLDTDTLCQSLDAPLLNSEGRSFPVEIHYRPIKNANERFEDQFVRVVKEALQQTDGHILAFLPAIALINRLCERLCQELPNDINDIDVLPLHGQLDDQQQARALGGDTNASAHPNRTVARKLLLATNIAESSLTIDGVRVVIDSGLERRMEFSPATGLSELKTRPISQASSIQRTGRAGRQSSGISYRLWSEPEQSHRPAHHQAEILSADLAPLLFELKQWGAEANELFWLDPPPTGSLNQASDLLVKLGLCKGSRDSEPSTLTEHGKACASTAMEPRLAHALLTSHQQGAGNLAANVIALLQEASSVHSDDLETLLQLLESDNPARKPAWVFRAKSLANRLKKRLPPTPKPAAGISPSMVVGLAYPDRIAQLRNARSSNYKLAQGSGIELLRDSELQEKAWLAVAALTGGQPNRVRLAAELTEQDLERLIELFPWLLQERIEISWQDEGHLKAERQHKLGDIIWRREPIQQLGAADWQAAWRSFFKRGTAAQSGSQQASQLAALNWTDENIQLRRRLALLRQSFPNDHWPDTSEAALVERMDDWLMPYLTNAKHQKHLKQLPLTQMLLSLLEWHQREQLDQLAPTHWTVPSGSRIRLEYQEDARQNPPVLAVKLQEMLGYEQQPSILNGRLPLMIQLLSPARRPIQITQDLPHFWRNSYAEVRKDMRGRYPKHPWPEDPIGAEATALTNRALSRRRIQKDPSD